MSNEKSAWDPENMGYGKHSYRNIDPSTINPADYARNLRGEEKCYGDVREYNTGANEKHPENDLDLYDLGLIGTIFRTNAEGHEGTWRVVDLPRVKNGKINVVVKGEGSEDPRQISSTSLGVTVNEQNRYEQVVSKLIKRGIIDREQRRAIETGQRTREILAGDHRGRVGQ